jgi:large repetitive protein
VALAPPTVRIASPRAGAVAASRVTVEVVAGDAHSAVEVTLNGQPMRSAGGDRYELVVDLQPGENTLTAVALNQAKLRAEDTVRLTLDQVPPVVKITSPASGLTNQRRTMVEVSARDAAGPVSVLLGGEPMEQVRPGIFQLGVALVEGPNTLTAVATDAAGNTAQDQLTLQVDSVPPTLGGALVAVIDGTVDPGSQVTHEGKPIPVDMEGRFRISVTVPAGGAVTIVAVDAAGNRTEKVYRVAGAVGAAETQ